MSESSNVNFDAEAIQARSLREAVSKTLVSDLHWTAAPRGARGVYGPLVLIGNAAKLFAEFMIGDEVQKLFPADGGFAARSDIAAPSGSPPLSSIKILPVDYDYIQKESARIKKRFNETFQ